MLKNITISRIVTQWLISSIGLFIMAALLPGVTIERVGTALVTAGVIGMLNAFLWPLFMRFALKITVATFGLASLILNGSIIVLTAAILPGFVVGSFWDTILIAFGMTIISTVARQLLVINDDDTYYQNVIKSRAKEQISEKTAKTPGLLFLQIDGLGYKVMQRAIHDGNVPTLAKWIRSGKYSIGSWETDWSSQTGASQAGILMGSNKEIPSFRWFEKDTGRSMVFGSPDDITAIEKRFTKKHGLLADNGASRGNLFSGNANFTLLTMSTVKNPDRKHYGQDYAAYFANPYNFTRTLILVVTDIIRELRSNLDQKRRDVLPRLEHRGRTYPLIRAWTTIVQRDIVMQTLISDMYKGRTSMYADFVGYDEVSHHSGIERHESLAVLRDIDQQFARLARAAEEAPRPYKMIILSDHGQTQGATFSQRTGYTLEDLVEKLTKNEVDAELENHESVSYLNAAVTEASQPKNLTGRMINALTKNYHKDDKKKEEENPKFAHNIKIMASGNLGLIYFKQFRHRISLEDIDHHYPDLIPGLLANPFIGFLLVDSKKHGGMVLGQKGTHFLKTDRVVGEDPLLPFGEHTAVHVKRTHTFKYTADIMINSIYDKTIDEVTSFEELIGSHGGLGGNQSQPFIMFPSDWYFPDKPVIGAENVHKVMMHWLADAKKSNVSQIHN